MTLDEIEKDWLIDSQINDSNLGSEALKIPRLHQKWYTRLVNEKISTEKFKIKLNEYEFILENYFNKTLTIEELEQYKLPPYSDKRFVKTDIPKLIATDKEVIKLKLQIMMANERVDFIKDILKMIHTRTFIIRDAIEWVKFTNGGA